MTNTLSTAPCPRIDPETSAVAPLCAARRRPRRSDKPRRRIALNDSREYGEVPAIDLEKGAFRWLEASAREAGVRRTKKTRTRP